MTQLTPRRFTEDADYNRTIHSIIPEFDTPIEAMLDPGYWAHISQRLKPWDKIEVYAEDGSFYAELIVKSAGKLYANVELLTHVPLKAVTPGAMESAPSGYHVKYRGTLQKWCVLRDEVKADGTVIPQKDVLKEGYAEETEARRWLSEFLKSMPPVAKPKSEAVNKLLENSL